MLVDVALGLLERSGPGDLVFGQTTFDCICDLSLVTRPLGVFSIGGYETAYHAVSLADVAAEPD